LPAASGKPFVDKLWSAQIPTGNYRYYDGTLYMLSLLHVSGTFKLYY
jgi:oligosaccharide reducing-end xylanase